MTYTDLPLIRLVARSFVSHQHHLCLSHSNSINALNRGSDSKGWHVCGNGIYVRPHLDSFPEYPSFDYRRSPITVVTEFRHRSTEGHLWERNLHLLPPRFLYRPVVWSPEWRHHPFEHPISASMSCAPSISASARRPQLPLEIVWAHRPSHHRRPAQELP